MGNSTKNVGSHAKNFNSHTKKTLSKSILAMAVVPIIVLVVLAITVANYSFRTAMYSEVSLELENVACGVDLWLSQNFIGDYGVYSDNNNGLYFAKGDYVLNDRTEYIQGYKEKTGVDISVLYDNMRFLTTIKGDNGEALRGTTAHITVEKDVLNTGKAKFYSSVNIGNNQYFAYYYPLINSDGSCVGMIEVAKQAKKVNIVTYLATVPLIVAMIVVMVIASVITVRFSSSLINDLKKLKNFMNTVANGNLKTEFDYELMNRNDEITDMCQSATIMQKSLRQLIEKDALTGLDNRRSANQKCDEYQRRLVEENEKYTLAIGDIDFFKKVNDTYGHDAGDAVLKMVSDILKVNMKQKGFAARWGGEEFLLGFKDCDAVSAAEHVNSILDKVREAECVSGDNHIKVTMSFGVATANKNNSIDENIKLADERLYFAKENGRNQVVLRLPGENIKDFQYENSQANDVSQVQELNEDIMSYINERKIAKEAEVKNSEEKTSN